MKILVACEESQTITKELRSRGHEAYSCDIVDCSGGHPEWLRRSCALILKSDPWVENGIKDVDDQIDEHEEQNDDHQISNDHRPVEL